MNKIILVVLVLIAVIAVPLLTIASINTLFGTEIAYGLKEWASALFLGSIISGYSRKG